MWFLELVLDDHHRAIDKIIWDTYIQSMSSISLLAITKAIV